MKAIVVHEFGAPEVLKLEDVPDPQPGPGQVVVGVRAAGVNPYDAYMRAGTYGARNPTLPFTPGSDAAGVVEAVGAGIIDLGPGDRVFTSGTLSGAYAARTLCLREQVHPLPENVSFSQGAGVWAPYATAYRALFQAAHAKPGETVLVHGASGGVGTASLQFAHAAGMTVIGTAGSESGLALLSREGAGFVANHRDSGYRQRILEMTGGRGADVILEMLASVNLGDDLKLLAPHGRAIVIGSRGDVTITPRDAMARDATIRGILLWNASEAELEEIHAALQAGLRSGTLRPIVGLELRLASAPEAHERIGAGGALGKIVLIP
jgi:NADPH2:quinone reductase